MSGGIKVPLGMPIRAYGEEVSEITLRRPSGKDIRECGYPFHIHAETEAIIPQAGVISKYIAALGKIPMGSVDSLDAPDFNACMGEIMGFFGASPGVSQENPGMPDGTSKTLPATSPPSSADTQAAS